MATTKKTTARQTVVAATPARAKRLSPADRLSAQRAQAELAEQERRAADATRVRAYRQRKLAEAQAQAQATAKLLRPAPSAPSAPSAPAARGTRITASQLVTTLQVHLAAARNGAPSESNAARVAALETAMVLAKLVD